MSLVAMVDRVDVLITKRAKTALIKRPLMTLREHCEAAELELSRFKSGEQTSILVAELKKSEVRNEALEAERKRLQRRVEVLEEENLDLKTKKPPGHGGTWPGQKGYT